MIPINVIHFADLHIGVDTYGPLDLITRLNGRVMDYLDAFDALVDYAKDEDADLVIFAGDAFHRHSPTPTYLREFGKRVVRLCQQCPVVLVAGNHDIPGSSEKASAVDIFETLEVAGVIVGNRNEVHNINTKSGPIQVATIPYSKDGILPETISKLAEEIDFDYPSILTGHFDVDVATYGSERMISIGTDAEVYIEDLLYHDWNYVALGHIHLHQCLCDAKHGTVVYAGSLERVSFSEENDPKGFVWVEIGDDTTWEFVEIDARPYRTIRVDAIRSKNPTRKVISKIKKMDLKEHVVRVIVGVADGEEVRIRQNVIREELSDAGVYYTQSINVEAERVIRSRLDGKKSVKDMDEEDKLAAYFELVDIEGDEQDELIDLAFDIMDEVDSEQF